MLHAFSSADNWYELWIWAPRIAVALMQPSRLIIYCGCRHNAWITTAHFLCESRKKVVFRLCTRYSLCTLYTNELKFIGAWMRILWTFLLASGMQQKVRMQMFVWLFEQIIICLSAPTISTQWSVRGLWHVKHCHECVRYQLPTKLFKLLLSSYSY